MRLDCNVKTNKSKLSILLLMIKTSTPTNNVNYQKSQSADETDEYIGDEQVMFYKNIQSELNQLIKGPQDETIDKILAYSSKKK